LDLFYIELSGLYWTRYNGWMTNTDVCNWFGMECSQANFSTSIDLKYNNLSELIPINIGYLSLLSEIDFAGNRLHGTIPSQVGSLENLRMLTVAANQVVAVPSSLANLTLLESLDLSMNQLTGTIPLAMCSDLLSLRHLIVDCDGRYSIMENCTCCM
jgi:LRR receptor-like serine/threonine-protein kinase FLS2